MDDDMMPEPEPAGALVPPPRTSPTAIATAAPLLPGGSSHVVTPREDFLRGLVRQSLDALDDVGDSIARAVGLR
jgi:hypothetical protein